MTDHLRTAATCVLVALQAACTVEDTGHAESDRSAPRMVDLGNAITTVGGSVADTLLLQPVALTTDGTYAFLFDYGDFRLKAFDLVSGQLEWSTGRPGEGPGEFKNPTQVALSSSDGTIWVVDAGAGRIAVLDRDEVIRYESLAAGAERVERVVRLRDGGLAIVFSTSEKFAAFLEPTGELEGSLQFPFEGFSSANPYQRQIEVAVAEDGRRWVAASFFTSDFAVFAGAEAQCTSHTRRVRLMSELGGELNPPFRTGAAAISDSTMVLLTRSDDRDQLDLLEFYDPRDCRYLFTARLPGRARGVALRDTRLVALVIEPAPALYVYDVTRVLTK